MDSEILIFNAKTRRKDQSALDYINETNGLIMHGYNQILERELEMKRYKDPEGMTFWFFQIYYIFLLEADHQISDIAYNAYVSFVKGAGLNLRPLTISEIKSHYQEYLSKNRYIDAGNFLRGHRKDIDSWNYNDMVYGFTRLMFLGENDINVNEYTLITNLLDRSQDKFMTYDELRNRAGYLFRY